MHLAPKTIENILASPELIDFIKKRVLPILANDPNVLKPRTPIKRESTRKIFPGDQNDSQITLTKENLDLANEELFSEESDEFSSAQFFQSEGVLTGGSICNLINEYIHGVPAVINDVDFFYYDFGTNQLDKVEHQLYENMVDESFNFSFGKSVEIGQLNKIEIHPSYQFSWDNLLDAFDLNCCQVALNLNTNELIYSPGFLQFLSDRVIHLTEGFYDYNTHNLTTFIRGTIKSKELAAKFYLNDHLKSFIAFNLSDEIFNNTSKIKIITKKGADLGDNCVGNQTAEFITQKRFSLLKQQPDLLMPWFKLEEEALVVQNLSNYSWFNFLSELSKVSKSAKNSEENSLGKMLGHISSILGCNPQDDVLNQSNATYSKILAIVESNLISLQDLETGINQKIIQKEELFKQSFSFKDCKELSQLTSDHTGLKKGTLWLLSEGYSFQEILTLYRRAKNQNLAILGIFENYIQDESAKKINTNPYRNYQVNNPASRNKNEYNKVTKSVKQKNFDSIFKEIEDIYVRELNKDKLCSPLDFNFAPIVTEITTQDKLTLEGLKMNHCVGGYGSKVRDGVSRIFHLEAGGKSSTLELIYQEIKPTKKHTQIRTSNGQFIRDLRFNQRIKEVVIVNQHRSQHNQKPIELHNKIAKRLINYLIYHYGKSKFNTY